MDELDKLKNDWKRRENSFPQLSEKEIYKMLHRKSSSLVKWILIISVLELLFWTVISVFYNTDDYLKTLKQDDLLIYFRALNWFNYGVVFAFIYLFYKNYISISTTSSTRTLMMAILRTRKTVQYYVWYNLVMIVISLLAGFALAFSFTPEVDVLQQQMASSTTTLVVTLLILFFAVVLAVVIFWLFYRVLYGIMLRKLNVNYKELEKIDN